jgi:L-seryl-tRNA(Ser) seleniumtransferase
MAAEAPEALERRAGTWAQAAGAAGEVVAGESMVGGGSLPEQGLPTWCAAITPAAGADRFAAALRSGSPPIVARIAEGRVLFDPRTVDRRDDITVEKAIRSALVGE